MSDHVAQSYVVKCLEPGSALRGAVHDMVLPETFAQSYGRLRLDRPLFVPESEISGFADDLATVFRILVSLPERVFGGDRRRFCRALGMDDRLAALMCLGATGQPPLYLRADAYHDANAFRLLELNIGSQLGGTDFAQLNRALLRVPAFKDFAERHRLGYVDTVGRLIRTLRAAAEAVTDSEPVVALIESTGGITSYRHVFDALREAMLEHGVRLLLGEVQELGEADGKAVLRGTPLDVVLRYFVAAEVVDDPVARDRLELLVRAHQAGRTVLYTPLEGAMFASKGALAMLHDPLVRERFSAAEQAVVDRTVPWTRLLSENGSLPADHAELMARCRTGREGLVLKPGVGHGGKDTVVGHAVTDEEWRQALLDRVTGDHVVQERVRPVGEPVVDAGSGAVHDWAANWGIFVDPDGYAGCFVRALKPSDGAIVAFANPETRGTCVFTTA